MRPETLNHVKDRTIRIATFETDKINSFPSLMKPYVALVEAVQKMDGEVNTTYGSNVEILIKKDREQLKQALESEQREWDRNADLYAKVANGEPIKSYQEYSVKAWAVKEALPEPEFVQEPENSEDSKV